MERPTDIRSKIDAIYSLEQLAGRNSSIHRLHPLCKLLGTIAFLVTAASFDRYSLGRLIPFVFYPVILMTVSETPCVLLLKRVLIAIPFCLLVGISNLFFDRGTAFTVWGIAVSYGMIAFFALLYRACLCVTAVLLLAAVTPFPDLTAQLRVLKVPAIFVSLFEMTYRYLGVLFGEAASMRVAYSLRGPRGSGVDLRHAGSFVGRLLLRSFDRAERIYAAMKCRGHTICQPPQGDKELRAGDVAYLALVCAFCVFFRVFDVVAWLTPLMEGMF